MRHRQSKTTVASPGLAAFITLSAFADPIVAYVPANDYFKIGTVSKRFEVTLRNSEDITLDLQLIDTESGDVLSERKLAGNSNETVKVAREEYLKVVNQTQEDLSIGLELSKENVGIRYSDRYYND